MTCWRCGSHFSKYFL